MQGNINRLRVLMVAGLTPVKQGGTGGQITEARTLYESAFAAAIDVTPLSSSMMSIPPPALWVRAAAAMWRMWRFTWCVPHVDVALIYFADGLSLIEKGVMAVIARLMRRGVVLRFGSGRVPAQCERHPLLKLWVRFVLRCGHVNASQGATWTEYFGRFPESRDMLTEIPNGIVVRPWPVSQQRVPGRIAYVGWISEDKGVFEALDALARVREECPHAHLVMAGGGPAEAAIRERIAALALTESVQLLGWISAAKVRDVLSTAEVFLFPSHYEGLPNAVLEAMAEGLPVVSTPVGAIPDVVLPGRTGALVQVGDAERLAREVASIVRSPEEGRRMGREARMLIEEKYAIDAVWRRFADVCDEAAKKAGRARRAERCEEARRDRFSGASR